MNFFLTEHHHFLDYFLWKPNCEIESKPCLPKKLVPSECIIFSKPMKTIGRMDIGL